jgi:protein SERAC1
MTSKFKKLFKRNKTQHEPPASDDSSLTTPPSKPNVQVTEPFPRGVKDWVECDDAEVDICFIHGLTGNRDSTWTTKGQAEPWPKTLLPAELPNTKASIFTYGYDAYIVRLGHASSNRLTNHAMNFLQIVTLDREKKNASNRPLVIVAHSLGGLVTKQAILNSKDSPEKNLRNMYNMTKGIIFMGTPHTGSWMANWSKIPADILGILKSANTDLLRVLQTNDELLNKLNRDFLYLLRTLREGPQDERKINVVCFFEEIGYPKIGHIVSEASATFASDPPISVHANHSDMVKFATASDAGFQSFAGQLRRWMDEIR